MAVFPPSQVHVGANGGASPLGGGGGGGVGGCAPGLYLPPFPPHAPAHVGPLQMLQMRMRWGQYSGPYLQQGTYVEPSPFDHVDVFHGKKDFIVFVLKDGDPVVIRDSHELFPSDTLITQLRMLEG